MPSSNRKTKQRRFRDVKVGETFEFESVRRFPFAGFARGPWRKTSARGYTHAEEGGKYTVGSINADVQ